MKKYCRLISVAMIIAMMFSLISVGLTSSAATAIEPSKQASSKSISYTASNLKIVDGVLKGTLTSGSPITICALYEGDVYGDGSKGPSSDAGKVAVTIKVSGEKSISFDNAIPDGGKSLTGYTLFASYSYNSSMAYFLAYFPPAGDAIKIMKDGAAIDNTSIFFYADAAGTGEYLIDKTGVVSYEITNKNPEIVTLKKNGDAFTLVPVGTGSAQIECVSVDERGVTTTNIFTVNVGNDATLSAVWLSTDEKITNGKTFYATAKKPWGFDISALPALEAGAVTLSDNTAGAVLTTSTIEGQFPYALTASNSGKVKVTIQSSVRTVSFIVDFDEAEFEICEDTQFDYRVKALTGVHSGSAKTFYASQDVDQWIVETSGGTTYTTTKNSITITAGAADTITTVYAASADVSASTVSPRNCLGWFDVYTLGELDKTAGDSVFKVDYGYAYNTAHGPQPTTKTIMKSVPETQTYKAYVPFREGGLAAGAESVEFDDGTVTLKFKDFQAKFTINSKEVIFSELDGSNPVTETIPSENEVPILETFTNDDGTTMSKTYLPARILSYVPQWSAGADGGKFIDYVSNADSGKRGEYVIYTEKSAYGGNHSNAISSYNKLISEALKAWGI